MGGGQSLNLKKKNVCVVSLPMEKKDKCVSLCESGQLGLTTIGPLREVIGLFSYTFSHLVTNSAKKIFDHYGKKINVQSNRAVVKIKKVSRKQLIPLISRVFKLHHNLKKLTKQEKGKTTVTNNIGNSPHKTTPSNVIYITS